MGPQSQYPPDFSYGIIPGACPYRVLAQQPPLCPCLSGTGSPAVTLAFRARSHSALVSETFSPSLLSVLHSLPRHTCGLKPQESLCPLLIMWGLSTFPVSPSPYLFHGPVHIHCFFTVESQNGSSWAKACPLPLTCACMRQPAQGSLRERFKEGSHWTKDWTACLFPLPTKLSVPSPECQATLIIRILFPASSC